MSRLIIRTSRRSSSVFIERTNSQALAEALKGSKADRLFVIYDAQVHALHREWFERRLARKSASTHELVIPVNEKSKSVETLDRLYDFLLSEKISRDDLIVACGGGVTTDLVGYAAASCLRGVAWGAVPTTLVGMIDAAIGGKTGINHALGKNLIGAIWQPQFVYVRTEFLKTLPVRQMVAGVGELLKYGGLVGKPMLEPLERYIAGDDLYDSQLLFKLVTQAVSYKTAIVSKDERESGIRAYLNLGHTFGHGIEQSLGYGGLLHGEAVIIGLLAALKLQRILDPRAARRCVGFEHIVEQCVELVPTRRVDIDATLRAMSMDKKRRQGKLRFILLDRPGKPVIRDDIPLTSIHSVLKETIAYYRTYGGKRAKNPDR